MKSELPSLDLTHVLFDRLRQVASEIISLASKGFDSSKSYCACNAVSIDANIPLRFSRDLGGTYTSVGRSDSLLDSVT